MWSLALLPLYKKYVKRLYIHCLYIHVSGRTQEKVLARDQRPGKRKTKISLYILSVVLFVQFILDPLITPVFKKSARVSDNCIHTQLN